MAGRPAKPIEMLITEGRKHLTKLEIAERKKSEMRFGDHKLKCPEFVRTDQVAYRKWKEIISLYKNFDFVSSGDSGLLSRYCKTFSEYSDLLSSYQRIKEIHYDSKELDEFLNDSSEDDSGEDVTWKPLFAYKVKKQLRDMISINALLLVESAINRKMDMLIKMEDRMFLNPLSKIKSIPKKAEKEASDPNADMFG